MKANFRKFPVYTSIRKDMVMEQDIAFPLANGLYTNIPGVMAHSLSLRIYESEGEMEITKEEADALSQWVDLFSGIVADSIKDYIKKHNT